MSKYKIGIVGATGYTGSELVRLLLQHPDVIIEIITSKSKAGKRFSEVHPHFEGIADMELQTIDDLDDHDLDLVFLALPHGVSMDFVEKVGYKKFKVIDLSGDFRLGSAETYQKWYGKKHSAEKHISKAVYGMPELFRDRIRNARLVANPGCYPTSAILALAPLFKNDLVEPEDIVIDSKSGVTGAGATAKQKTHFPEVFGNFSAYGLKSHRHTPEIQTTLQSYSGTAGTVQFSPHLLPIDRGILTTTYSRPKKAVSEELLRETYLNFYEKEHFVRVADHPPALKSVRGSNFCDVYATYDERTNRIITVSTIDNLVKGAAGQAIQNMNLMFGLIERSGLELSPLSP